MDPHLSIILFSSVNWVNTSIYLSIIIVLLIFSSFFSKCETVFSSVSKAKLMTLVDENKKGARKALWLSENYDEVLSVILVGNNLVNIAISTLGLRLLLGLFLTDASWVDIVNTILITIIVLIFGEVFPKSRGKAFPEKNALRLSGILYVVVKILKPISYPFYKVNKLTRENGESEADNISSDDLENIIDTMEDSGEIDTDEADMLQKVLDLREIDVKNIMTPRVDCVCLDVSQSIEEIKECFFENQFSRVPVYEGTIDHVIGILFEKEFFKAYIENNKIKDIRPILQKPLFVVGSMSADKLLSLLKLKNVHLAVVLDEYGGFDGVVTMEDCLEEVVGEIFDEHDEVPFTINRIGKDKYLVNGDLEIENLFDYFNFEDENEYEATTVGGLIQDLLERVPIVNDVISIKVVSKVLYDELSPEEGIEYKELTFKVKEIENNRIIAVELLVSDFKNNEEE
ncbi:HlyC/CorC family transporter [bacterium]|nr:HlyC/CorC family transporter [bacterium]